MLIYNITTHIESQIESEWVEWMRQTYRPLMFATGKFRAATFTKVVQEAHIEGKSYSVQYTTPNKATLESFLAEDAPRLELEAQNKFGNQALTFATELELIGQAQIKEV